MTRLFPLLGGGTIPWEVIEPFEAQARKNHGDQSLEKLASRGGMSVYECVHVIEGVSWYGKRSKEIQAMTDKQVSDRLHALTASVTGAQRSCEMFQYCPECHERSIDGSPVSHKRGCHAAE